VSFVRAEPRDVPAIEALVRAAYAPYVERIGREPAPMSADYSASVRAGRVLLARHGTQLLGALVTDPRPDCLLIENVAVEPRAQGLGIGGRLLDQAEAEAEAKALGLPELRLYTNAMMTENLSYYPRRGYREVGRRVEDGFDRVYFLRMLVQHDGTGGSRRHG
jgi:GNAT superfamily N-acetyltransferase